MKIQAVVPAWNAADTLAETLDSIAAQTVLPDEVIVVDDGSTDATAEIASSHPLDLKLIRTENRGLPSALNTGIAAGEGDAIAILDADDLWMPEKTALQKQVLLEQPEVDIVVGYFSTFECPSIAPERFKTLKYVKGGEPGYLGGCLLVRRKWLVAEEFRFDEQLKNAHLVDWFRKTRHAHAVEKVIPETVMRRRIRPGTLGSRTTATPDSKMSPFVLEVARRALQQKRKLKDHGA
ncbi:MAG: glycosyltransferase family A protein [Pseudomonadota bacterium]